MNIVRNIQQIAKEVLQNEARAVENLTNFIDNDFEACVREIFQCNGRVVVTGIGKSAIIANKIVATFNSTGTPSLFMHGADAIHGDLGMIQNEDLVTCISKGSSTPEIKVLVPVLKRRGSKHVALVSNTNSSLAHQADYALNATVAEEACPHNLAPTTSTTAMAHPGGAPGKQLYLKVYDIYTQHELPFVKPDTLLNEVILEISSQRLGATAVVDDKKNLFLGIITDGDLRRMLQKETTTTSVRAGRDHDQKSKIDRSRRVGGKNLATHSGKQHFTIAGDRRSYRGGLHSPS